MRYLFIALLFLTACSVGPDYKAPEMSVSGDWASQDGAVSTGQLQAQWWKVFDDPLLEQYITAAAKNNKDVRIALANVRKARASRKEEAGAFFPDISGSSSADRSQSSGASSGANSGQVRDNYDAGFDASWEIDVFGGTRRSVEAADARVGSAVAGYQDVLLSVLSETARSYYEARGLQKQIAILEKNTNLLNQTFELVQARLEVGETSEFDLARARGELQLTRARIPNLEADLKARIFTLSVLLGQPPEALLAQMQEVKSLPTPPDIVPVGLRSDILRRRPDIRQAERETAAAVADIGVETAELFPKFFLTGDIGTQALLFGDLFTAASKVWSLGAMMNWSVFEGGAIRARIEGAEADSEAALIAYEKAVLEALADVETALTRYGQELETRRRLQEGVQSRLQAVSLARELFDVGEEDYLAVLDAERELTASEDDLIVSETQSIIKLISLYTALGGGWESAASNSGQ